ncbi:expressed unknown protein [Seminavis robusta]|uniref:Cytidyltransferase-like domain-containing protein n=1 Tax=Seminavis robusta TaxID=568900 RepID=A0A9N8D904_9STRA|nr:expressed unknown protein [Seminavis robusta]|eukprot:Sro19_g013560.1 n/a (524) ;mRNA; f:115836-117407
MASSNTTSTVNKADTDEIVATTTQIPGPPPDAYSLEDLQQRAQWLIQNHASFGKVAMAIAGGGGHALSTLAATSGASQLLLEGTVTYDRASFQRYVNKTQQSIPSSGFSYSSLDAARMASQSALLQGMQLRATSGTLAAIRDTVGVGSASTLKTTTAGGMSKSGRPSRGNVVATRANGTQTCMQYTLNCGPTQNTRFQQDVLCSHMILQTMETLAEKETQPNADSTTTDDATTVVDPETFEGITIRQWMATTNTNNNTEQQHQIIQKAANRILSGHEKAVLLLPKLHTANSDDDVFLEPLVYPVLPDNCLIMPGSFNPPHPGHVGLARAAIAKMSTGDESSSSVPLVFELSITNADKPAMEADEVARRVSLFRDVMPDGQQWGILLTSAPLFSDKIRALQQYYTPTDASNKWSFVIGTDTMVRVLNSKYYNDSYEQMLQAQRSMGAGFVVGGRLNQDKQKQQQQTNIEQVEFVTGEEALVGLPEDVQELFVLLKESDFRADISSSEIRAAEAAKAQANGQETS